MRSYSVAGADEDDADDANSPTDGSSSIPMPMRTESERFMVVAEDRAGCRERRERVASRHWPAIRAP